MLPTPQLQHGETHARLLTYRPAVWVVLSHYIGADLKTHTAIILSIFCRLLLIWQNIRNVFPCHQILSHSVLSGGLIEFHC